MIVQLLRIGKKVGVAANSHAAIANLLAECVRQDPTIRGTKIGGSEELEAGFERGNAKQAVAALAKRPLVGGTAWAFSKPDFEGELDALFVDEAGQVSLANLVGMARCAKNLVLLGDQMQLAQPLLGSHPGESGVSALSYLLQDHATIPPDLGIFLGTTWRLHPDLCRFISGAVYEDRLAPRPENARRIVRHRAGGSALVPAESGIVWVPIPHEGNAQASDEEIEAIDRIVADLLGREVVTGGGARPLALSDILFVAPYNMQVRRLRHRLGPAAKVGSVDLFQGQEAPVVIVSMCASSADASPRGMEFLLDRNRMNVAISRAQSLAIVVGSPDLLSTRASSLGQMRLLNLFSRLVAEASPSQPRRAAAQH